MIYYVSKRRDDHWLKDKMDDARLKKSYFLIIIIHFSYKYFNAV